MPLSSHLQSFPASGLFQWVSSSYQVAKLLEFQLQHQSCQWIFRTDFFEDWLVLSLCSPRDPQDSFKSYLFSVISFCLFILFMGFSRQEYWSGLSFHSLVDHFLSELSTMICLSWVALHSMAHSFIELGTAVVHVISFLWRGFHSVCPLTDKDKRLMEASYWEGLTIGETGSCFERQGHAQ